MMELLRGEL
uniref:Uncharacterized protein n=1 Tax=Anguilla anguilla TaxID=7936 RepID=A0A0E9TUJ3_ANGAN